MTMDHVENDRNGAPGSSWADAKARFGDGYYQLRCFNCNTGRHLNGGVCPHQERH